MNIKRATLLLSCCLFLYYAIAAQAQEKLCDTETSFGRSDNFLFAKQCATCHSLSGQWKKVAPPLGNVFKKKALLTGQLVSKENVREIVSEGIPNLMPGFRYTLTPAQIDQVVSYLQRVRCPDTSSSAK
jgi:hypothetical protein